MKPLEVALSEYGKEAYPGTKTNPEVLKYFTETGYTFIHDDETPWCAAFLNWVLQKCKIDHPNKLNARSFLEMKHATSTPELGDIVILWRINPIGALGHTGLYIRENKNLIWILGGNQNSTVNIRAFPKNQLLGYRSLAKI